jgi:hypothetical protein
MLARAVTAIDLLRTLFRQMEWADAAVWRAVPASPAACADAGLRERLPPGPEGSTIPEGR